VAEKSVCQIGEIFIATSVYNLSVFSVGRVLTVQLLYILQKITVLRFCLVTPELNGSDVVINRNSYNITFLKNVGVIFIYTFLKNKNWISTIIVFIIAVQKDNNTLFFTPYPSFNRMCYYYIFGANSFLPVIFFIK